MQAHNTSYTANIHTTRIQQHKQRKHQTNKWRTHRVMDLDNNQKPDSNRVNLSDGHRILVNSECFACGSRIERLNGREMLGALWVVTGGILVGKFAVSVKHIRESVFAFGFSRRGMYRTLLMPLVQPATRTTTGRHCYGVTVVDSAR